MRGRVQIVLYKNDDFEFDTLFDLCKMVLLCLELVLKYNLSLGISMPGINRDMTSDRKFKILRVKRLS
ncbi:ribosome maturation factor RimP [Borrelia miyamotoi]|nr:Putative cytosolic protein [Borrelia miyamotoi FR64b]BCR09194.1 ribosome maturation factor RimP [Borrelia miyamotoi]BCR10024.1 ribosome maturation factor RimP [Borrelia miyamotoi]BCR10852.1 ribosome maturation factor RimP [Borrelia miyamotoi]BCR11682.1 ribosome maturation factor RimP [Borrelia miyamotoi]